MKRKIVWLAMVTLLFSLAAPGGNEREGRTFQVSGPVSLSLSNISGNIAVKGWDQNTVRVVPGKSSSQAEVSMQQTGDRIWIVAKKGGIDFEVMTPRSTNLEVRSARGDISVSGLNGPVESVTTNGDIHLEDIRGRITAKVVSGKLTLQRCQSDLITLTGVSSDLSLTEVSGRVEGKSVSGDVRFSKSRCAGLDIKTTSGDIIYDGSLMKDGSYVLNTHSGNIRLSLPADSSFDMTAHTFSGEIETAFPLRLSPGGIPRKHGRSVLHGSYGDGQAKLELQTFSGDIRLKKQ